MLSRIGILGDIHAEAALLESALHFLARQKVERILCVGDVADGFGDANRCCDLLREFGVATVRGNHDRWVLNREMRELDGAVALEALSQSSIEFLRALPLTLRFETVRGPLLLCHGVGENDVGHLKPDDYGYALECNDDLQVLIRAGEYRFAVGGHTHQRMVRHFGGLTFINPGALARWSGPCFAVADFAAERVEFWDFDAEQSPVCEENVALR